MLLGARRALETVGTLAFVTGFIAAIGCDGCGGRQPAAAAAPDSGSSASPGSAHRSSSGGTIDSRPGGGARLAQAIDAGTRSSAPRVGPTDRFLQWPDEPTRTKLLTQPIADVEHGSGGRSLGFKITLADGTKGYYKPEQTFSAAHWYGEIAAYYLDRELGMGRVAPVVGRRFEWSQLRRAAGGDARVAEVIVRDRSVRGCFVWWLPDRPYPWRVGHGWERWVRVDGWPRGAITPFQRARSYREARSARRGAPTPEEPLAPGIWRPERGLPSAGIEPDRPDRPAELSDMLVFDYLTQNVDRWGGNNANVMTLGRPGPLIHFDNAAGFTPAGRARQPLMDVRLRVVQRFRRRTIEAIRALDVARLKQRMASDSLAPILDDDQLAQLEERRRFVLEHVAEMERHFGADQVFPW